MWQRKKSKNCKKPPMETLVQQFCEQEFPEELPFSRQTLVNAMIAVLHSHRYQKGESFADGIDFTPVRGVLYAYSQES